MPPTLTNSSPMIWGWGAAPTGMSTHTVQSAPTPTVPTPSPAATLGARLAEASRRTQGFTAIVDDPAVLAELRGLCTAPRPVKSADPERREGPAP